MNWTDRVSQTSAHSELRTERLLLREWRDEDLEPFAALNADSEVMRFMPKLLSRDECAAMMQRIRDHFRDHGFGLWAVEAPGVAPFTCQDADEFLFWDGIHPTKAGHAILARETANVLW